MLDLNAWLMWIEQNKTSSPIRVKPTIPSTNVLTLSR